MLKPGPSTAFGSARRILAAIHRPALRRNGVLCITALILIACGTRPPAASPTAAQTDAPTSAPTSVEPSATAQPTSAPTGTADQVNAPTTTPRPSATAAPDTPTAAPVAWQDMPIVPVPGERVHEIYERGLQLGRNPRAFAKIGDCGGTPSWFLGPFDGPADGYRLGEYDYLQEVIVEFSGSFGRESVAARPGFNVSSIFSPLWADPTQCNSGEGPLICEIRVTNAGFAFFMMGSNDVWHKEDFEPQMRRALDDLIERGVVPILSTKADNVEQDGSINDTIVKLAREYDLPLWNFWASVQHLPDYGLQEDGVHMTWAGNRFDDDKAMSHGWPWRNLTALQALHAVWSDVTQVR
jgi:hypothetical protein